MSFNPHEKLIARSLRTDQLGALSALDAAAIGYWEWDLHDAFEWNHHMCSLFGLSDDRVPANLVAFLDLLEEDSQKAFLEAGEHSQKTGAKFDLVLRTEKIPSKAHTLQMIGQVLRPAGSMNQRLTGLCFPLSPSAEGFLPGEAFPPSDKWTDLFDVLSEVCIEADFDGRIVRANPAMAKTLDLSINEIEGRSFLDFIHLQDIPRTREKAAEILDSLAGRPVTSVHSDFENRYRRKDGSYRWFAWSWITDPLARRVYGIARDVTDSKSKQLRQEATLEQLTRSNQDLQNFASVASHDLREPLRMITSYLRLLQERSPEALDEKGRKFIAYACEGADRMRTMIEDLLAYSRLEQGCLEKKEIDLCKLLQQVSSDLQPSITASRAELHVHLPRAMSLEGDPIRLYRLFQNLLSNAIKFHPPGTRPEVWISARPEGGAFGEPGWQVCVRDNGIGIQPDHEELLFQLFQRLNTREAYEGSGIGLAVCKRVVDMHQGRIWFESKVGSGSSFFVWLKKELLEH